MKKYLGDILLEKGYISSQDLNKALTYQMRKVLGDKSKDDWISAFLLDVARTKYNKRDEFYIGKILTELKMLPETRVQEALEIQKASPADRPQGKLDALNRIIVRMNSSYNLIDLLNQMLVLAAQLVEAESASLIIHDRSRDTLVILMPVGPGAEAVRDLEIPKGRGIVGWVYESSHSVISNDTAKDTRFYAAIDAASGYTSRQVLCVPLTVKDKKLGAIEAINKIAIPGQPPQSFSQSDQFLLEMFSAQAAVAIENTRLTVALARLEEDLAVRAAEVPAAQRAHIAAMIAESFMQEMRRSLIPLQGYGARLKEVSADERVEKYRSYIDREMARLIAHTEDVARLLNDGFVLAGQKLSLREILRELESRVWVECRISGIAFEMEVKEDLVVGADRELLLKALENLFLNSRDAMPEGGTFSLVAQRAGRSALELSVVDSGKGIDVTPLELVFEPFFTSGKRYAAGLGLAITKRIVEMHGGTIRACNRIGSPGAQFTITLPAG
jgi:signal transduction histidine kinase